MWSLILDVPPPGVRDRFLRLCLWDPEDLGDAVCGVQADCLREEGSRCLFSSVRTTARICMYFPAYNSSHPHISGSGSKSH